jgi:RNA polymerase sigma-70 factor (ECF subfamily)
MDALSRDRGLMSDLAIRLANGDPDVKADIERRYGRAVVAWLRSKYPTLTAGQAKDALRFGLDRLLGTHAEFDPETMSLTKRFNELADWSALGLLLKTDFAAVVEHLGSAVQGYIRWMLRRTGYSGDIQDTAEDVQQQTFLAAWRSLERFDPARSVKAWLWKIARNCLVTELRRRRRTTTIAPEFLETKASEVDDDATPAVLQDFCQVLDGIPTHHQDLLFMSVENNCRYGREVVNKLAFASPTSVRVTRSRLVRKIRDEMQKRGHFPASTPIEPAPAAGRPVVSHGELNASDSAA